MGVFNIVVLEGDQRNMMRLDKDKILFMDKADMFQGIVSNFEKGVLKSPPISFKYGLDELLMTQNKVLGEALNNNYKESKVPNMTYTVLVMHVLKEPDEKGNLFEILVGAVGNTYLLSIGKESKEIKGNLDIDCYMSGKEKDLKTLDNVLFEYLISKSVQSENNEATEVVN